MRTHLTLAALAAPLLWSTVASAQYLDPPAPGYLPAASRGPAVDSPLFEEPAPVLTLGGAFNMGALYLDTRELDRDYFSVNDAHEMGGVGIFEGNFAMWATIHSHLRLGFDTGWGSGGDGRGTGSMSGGGLLIEGGGFVPYSPWSFWGGAVLGRGRVAIETDDDPGNFFRYESTYNRVELQGHAQVQIAPMVSLRGSAHLVRGWIIDDELIAGIRDGSDVDPILPADVAQPMDAYGFSIGLVLGR